MSDINRRTLLKSMSIATGAGITGVGFSTSALAVEGNPKANHADVTASETDRIIPIRGRGEREYIKKAMSDILETDGYAPLRDKLSKRDYKVTSEDALVTEKVTREDETTTVFLPIESIENDAPIGDRTLGDKSNTTTDDVEFGHVVWQDDSPSEGFGIVTGDAEKIVTGIDFGSGDVSSRYTSGIETIFTDSHNIELSSEAGGISRQSDGGSGSRVTTINMDTEIRPATSTLEATTNSDYTSCPSSIPTILAAIGGCGASCSGCGSLGIGNPTAIFACIGCASCGCALGCCLGERSSTLCTAASAYLSLPSILRNPGMTAGAICVEEGCDDKTCF